MHGVPVAHPPKNYFLPPPPPTPLPPSSPAAATAHHLPPVASAEEGVKYRLGLPPPPPGERSTRHGRHPVEIERLGHLAPCSSSTVGGGIGRPFHEDGLAKYEE